MGEGASAHLDDSFFARAPREAVRARRRRLPLWQAPLMAQELDRDTSKAHLRAAVAATAFGFLMVVAFSIVTATTNLAGLSGIGIGIGFVVIWGSRALWLLHKLRRDRL